MPIDLLTLFSMQTAGWFTETFGVPTPVQEESWTAIAAGNPVLVSAPTGTGKTLSAFLIFIDRLNILATQGKLQEELYLLYVSPLKSLAGDIRENLRRPLEGIKREEGQQEIHVAIRTGDTPQRDRQRMIKHPPHILITTPESLYLMLTSKSGQGILKTARAVVVDELHALIDTKRGAHLMLSIARLDRLCGRRLQRIGLSATIEPLKLAAEYLSPEPAVIAAPSMEKRIRIEVVGTVPYGEKRRDPIWAELAKEVYRKCLACKSVIAFCEGRRYAEKLAYYVNQLGGEDFARVHHGSLSKEQRMEVEQSLRGGNLRLLCATSSMELGIDVGEIDQVIQVGCPRTVSGAMQRLGRAGHNPGRVSEMYMYPRNAPESVYCGMTAELARQGGVEHTRPPRLCLDVLAQHLVSMAAGENYGVEQVMEILGRAYPFREVTPEDVRAVLRMLAGDYEHSREIPVRPRVLYDRLHDRVTGDIYSRMLAVSAGGTIPDKGLYTAKTQDGVLLGELDEEFVYESQLGDRFVLGAFAWKIVRFDRDSVVVTQVSAEGARLPFWKGEIRGRAFRTSLAFGRILRSLMEAEENGRLQEQLNGLGLDQTAALNAEYFLRRQITATGGLPDDRTILIEHFTDHTGCHQMMVHAVFGRRVNAPLSLLTQHAAVTDGLNLGCVDEEDGFLLYPYGEEALPEGLLYRIDPDCVRTVLETVLPVTPLFGMTFRYNAARALMMGMKSGGRNPLWMQRLRSAEMLDSLIREKDHPLIRETRRECLEDHWDIDGVLEVLNGIRSGRIAVREISVDVPSPMSLPLKWQVEAAEMYEYNPTTPGLRSQVYEEMNRAVGIRPSPDEFARQEGRRKLPENPEQLHTLLMIEGDLTAGELAAPLEWLESLAEDEVVLYREPGLWIAAEQQEEYERALEQEEVESGASIVRRMLYYRGGQTAEEIRSRYVFRETFAADILECLRQSESVVEDEGIYYHSKRYASARKATLRKLRFEAVTRPPEQYAALMADAIQTHAPSEEQLKNTIERYCGDSYPARYWENIIFAGRIKNYTEATLDRLLAQGEYFWRMEPEGNLSFRRYEDIDWEAHSPDVSGRLEGDERLVYQELSRRGASFAKFLTGVPAQDSVQEVLLRLAEKGYVCADSFVPVRQWINQDRIKKATARQRVNARVTALSAGRWDILRPLKPNGLEGLLEQCLREYLIICRETFRRLISSRQEATDWRQALELLRIWEYTGRVRRGYFVEGLSGAQFVRREDYDWLTSVLSQEQDRLVWLNAADPAQVWGRLLELPEERSFLILPGTAVALYGGRPVAAAERQGKLLRVFEKEYAEAAVMELARVFRRRGLYPDLRRLVIKEYPKETEAMLEKAGFMREMQDYTLYR